jgi:hypothetical protein
MALMISEVYYALVEAGASEEKARLAAEAVAGYENRLITLEHKLDRLAIELRVYAGLLVTIGLAILWQALK